MATLCNLIKTNLCVLIILGLLFGCKEAKENIELSKEKAIAKTETTKLNFIGHWLDEGLKGKLVKEFVRDFEFTHQDIDVNLTFNSTLFDNRGRFDIQDSFMLRQMLMPVPQWDIIYFPSIESFNHYLNDPGWMKKYLVDFSEIPEFSRNIRPELLTPEFKSQYGGILPGIFITSYTWSLWCNTEVAKKVDIDVKQFNMTFDDFLGYLKAVNEYNKLHGENLYGIFEVDNSYSIGALALLLYFSEVGNLSEIRDGQFSLKKLKAFEKTLTELEKMDAFKPFPSNLKDVSWDAANEYILKGQCLFYFNASWMYNIWQKKDEIKLKSSIKPVEPPSFEPNIATLGGYLCDWVVLKNSPHREQAVKFLTAMSRNDFAEKWDHYTKSPTGLKLTMSSSSFGKDQFETYTREINQKYGSAFLDIGKTSFYILGKNTPWINLYINDVMYGKIKASEAIKRIRADLKRNKLI